jgi:hypothetical protein
MLDSIMLPVAHVNYPIIRTKAICMNGRSQINLAASNGLNAGLFAVYDDLRINPAIMFINAEDDCFTSCSASALASDSARAEVRFIQFNITTERRLSLAMLSDSLANQSQIAIDCIRIQSTYSSNLSGSQIKCKELEKLPKFSVVGHFQLGAPINIDSEIQTDPLGIAI